MTEGFTADYDRMLQTEIVHEDRKSALGVMPQSFGAPIMTYGAYLGAVNFSPSQLRVGTARGNAPAGFQTAASTQKPMPTWKIA
jgi:hypothetical protein